ncbi:ABC transporter ATP-binding protein/permease [Acaryochloris sp. IP29b_bin.137]|uniref:ABC transporter ATP-binding protein/permease n=1 Tax=Acaryochloris sp. IP29b_bin.137 TaxID=2969217 RepID=UPI002631F011|nr:ABC transporter ATP-binding protein/permease [Acaryochloris sp. IP29b_bin.137]
MTYKSQRAKFVILSQLKPFLQKLRPLLYTDQKASSYALLIALSLVSSIFIIWESIQRGEFISALAARDASRFQRALIIFIAVLLATAILQSVNTFIRDRLSLQWRKALTHRFLKAYLAKKSYYHLTIPTYKHDSIDNPDQRLSEDIKLVSQTTFLLGIVLVESLVQLVGFIGVIWAVSHTLTGFLIGYCLLGTAITGLCFGRPLTRINTEQLKCEANFRFGLINLREHAESISFYQGQQAEETLLKRSFAKVVANFNRLIRWSLGLNLFQNGYQYLTFIIPSVILAPSILSGQLEVGAIVQSQAAFDRIWLSLSLIIVQFENLTTLAASINRLNGLDQSLQSFGQSESLNTQPSPLLAVEGLSLFTPNNRRCLCHELSFEVPIGQNLLITGPSGVGKSTLVKTLAGLWRDQQGILLAPTEIMFLPQQPYLRLGTLRQQLLYPLQESDLKDIQIAEVLQKVDLPDLAQVPLNITADWSQRLSLGEQQRLSFARLLLQRPLYAILDEATSAVTVEQEQKLYQQLQAAGVTTISIGHRPSLVAYHNQILSLRMDSTWQLQSPQDYHFA